MRIFILDSNIIWTTAFNPKSRIGQFVMSSDLEIVRFYAPTFLKAEMERHIPRIVAFSGKPEATIRQLIEHAYTRISFISDEQIPFEHYATAAPLVRDIDMDDIVFVALAEYTDNLLWTGDKALYAGLRARGYDKVVNWEEVQRLIAQSD